MVVGFRSKDENAGGRNMVDELEEYGLGLC
jgi:hypothetical protein